MERNTPKVSNLKLKLQQMRNINRFYENPDEYEKEKNFGKLNNIIPPFSVNDNERS